MKAGERYSQEGDFLNRDKDVGKAIKLQSTDS